MTEMRAFYLQPGCNKTEIATIVTFTLTKSQVLSEPLGSVAYIHNRKKC